MGDAIDTLADMLEQKHEEEIEDAFINNPNETPEFVKQLLNDAMDQVNWRDVAEHLLED